VTISLCQRKKSPSQKADFDFAMPEPVRPELNLCSGHQSCRDGYPAESADRDDSNDRGDMIRNGDSTFQSGLIVRLIKSLFEKHDLSHDLAMISNHRTGNEPEQ
jgi:hypothetical protein